MNEPDTRYGRMSHESRSSWRARSAPAPAMVKAETPTNCDPITMQPRDTVQAVRRWDRLEARVSALQRALPVGAERIAAAAIVGDTRHDRARASYVPHCF